jgi:hypothetical protein
MDGASHHPRTQDLAWLGAPGAREKSDPPPGVVDWYLDHEEWCGVRAAGAIGLSAGQQDPG